MNRFRFLLWKKGNFQTFKRIAKGSARTFVNNGVLGVGFGDTDNGGPGVQGGEIALRIGCNPEPEGNENECGDEEDRF